MKNLRNLWLLVLIAVLALALVTVGGACDDDDDDDDDAVDDDDDNDDDNDTTDDDTTVDDDDDTTPADDDDDDDTTPADDDDDDDDDTPTGNPFIDGGFDLPVWEPCQTAGCTQAVYASQSEIFQVTQFSNVPTTANPKIDVLVLWSFPGDTIAGDSLSLFIDLSGAPVALEQFVILFANATISPLGAITADAVYISTDGTMDVDAVGTTMLAPFSGSASNIAFTEAIMSGSSISIVTDGKIGNIDLIEAAANVLVVPAD
jgi:hypothetical protein